MRMEVDNNKLKSGKIKFENYLRSQDASLGVIFAVLDTDSSKAISLNEFRRKMQQIHARLD